jgi:hypothetical protein
MRHIKRRTAVVAVVGGLLVSGLAGTVLANGPTDNWPYNGPTAHQAAPDPVLAAVGDIACEPTSDENSTTPAALKCGSPTLGGMAAEYATADQVENMHPDLVALLGDEQYEVGKLTDFMASFDKTFGAFKFLQRPAPGNHEFYPYAKHGDNEAGQNGAGYYSYYNGQDATGTIRPEGQAGDSDKGWYSYNLGRWHIISLNIECNSPAFGNSCDPTTGLLGQETQWLANDLSANRNECTLAYWHQPTFSATGATGTGANTGFASDEGAAADAWWKLLYQNGADVILNGHEHVYARFQPQNPAGQVDLKHGLTQFTVGTGGEDLDTLAPAATLLSQHVVTSQASAFGVLKLTLGKAGYSWNYSPVLAGPNQPSTALDYSDSGTAKCHGPAKATS